MVTHFLKILQLKAEESFLFKPYTVTERIAVQLQPKEISSLFIFRPYFRENKKLLRQNR